MIKLEESTMLQILYQQGYSKKSIAKTLGMSINTVRKYIKTGAEPCYKSREKKPLKLDPYKAYIDKRLKNAAPHWVPASVVYREIQSFGYTGCSAQVRAYMHPLKHKAEDVIVRYETEPGYQMQVDWAEFRRGHDRLSAFIATLGYSRASYVEFVTDETLSTLIRCHEGAFDYFGGIPYTALYDNMKTVIITRNGYGPGQHRFQAGFWDFAKHYGFLPKVCKPYRAQTKGKVERFIHYLKHSFYYPLVGQLNALGLTLDKDTANHHVLAWLRDVANQRVHATTGAVPLERLSQEQRRLQPLISRYSGQVLINLNPAATKPKLACVDTQVIQHDLAIYQQLLDGEVIS